MSMIKKDGKEIAGKESVDRRNNRIYRIEWKRENSLKNKGVKLTSKNY